MWMDILSWIAVAAVFVGIPVLLYHLGYEAGWKAALRIRPNRREARLRPG